MTVAGDRIEGSVGGRSRGVAIGKHIHQYIEEGDDDELSDKDKFNDIYRLVWEIRERVSVLRTWFISLTIALVIFYPVAWLTMWLLVKISGGL